MSLKDLTKRQMQYIALGGMGAVVLAVIIVFGIRVSLSSTAMAKLELDDLMGKIESADLALSKQDQIRREFAESMGVLKAYLRDAPPSQNYYSWATEAIYAKARLANLEVDAIDEQARTGIAPEGEDGKTLKLESYSLRVTAHGGYDALKYFLELIEKDHPLARVITVDISTGTGPEIHDMQLVIQWPFNLGAVSDAWVDIVVKQQIIENPEPMEAGQQAASFKKMPVPPPPRPGSMTVKPEPSKE